jgi:hypothetical protein
MVLVLPLPKATDCDIEAELKYWQVVDKYPVDTDSELMDKDPASIEVVKLLVLELLNLNLKVIISPVFKFIEGTFIEKVFVSVLYAIFIFYFFLTNIWSTTSINY